MLVSLILFILGIRLLHQNIWIAVLNIFFFGICFIVYVINFIPNATYLKLEESGITMKTLFKTTFIPWKAVQNFDTKNIFLFKMVTFNLNENLTDSKTRSKQGAFPDTYGMSAKRLSDLLNEYKHAFDPEPNN